MNESEEEYFCVGICMPDPDSGYCLGCGRPPLPVSSITQGIVVEELRREPLYDALPNNDSPDRS
ncbi:MAG: DUF1289 domain-containing protein [Candidatus Accumulibacter phosphatis]|uniref:DUF1289 domain-containing protein n=2 Tax=Candidatus Accumulibacter TaxID=327159 RepID=A0A080M388_9PROT|nr:MULTISPECIES: DUF1289 domain-containing protein [Candidatus Accumulibacter]KFB74820.1 MAG: hypothetical protein AW06_004232 [Candidatus Accumulibacter cognatus]MBL8399454.1 DUF1289 domain-containing protein [Accumulibacter sp.]MBN8520129.1 DUF1289 domain-containing protein [Accumulibacter sp.]MCC2868137.1 DUF1289 domain-containing protein [Candidatus Accumulibacter phosphatis]MCM8579864.1 DUF1289 domain-containing protein [Accumulibacter sp.]